MNRIRTCIEKKNVSMSQMLRNIYISVKIEQVMKCKKKVFFLFTSEVSTDQHNNTSF